MREFLRNYLRASYLVPGALVASTFAIVMIAGANPGGSSVASDPATEISTAASAALTATRPADITPIPAPALRAYQEAAAAVTNATSTSACTLDWQLLAGLGAAASDHGRELGRLDAAGGQPQGPFQFSTAAWDVYGADANGDGVRDATDIDDAALAAALFLCATGDDLTTSAGTQAAVEAYNRDAGFVGFVLDAAAAYRAPAVGGTAAVPAVLLDDSDLATLCRDEIGAAELDLSEVDRMVLLCTETYADTDLISAKAEIRSLVKTLR